MNYNDKKDRVVQVIELVLNSFSLTTKALL